MMITTSSFPNLATPSPKNDMKRNSLTKEDLEGVIKKNIASYPQSQSKNGGTCQNIKI